MQCILEGPLHKVTDFFFYPRQTFLPLPFFFILSKMSMLQRISRSINWSLTNRTFSTSRIALAETTTPVAPVKATGLYQFFENNESLPKQNWTGKLES